MELEQLFQYNNSLKALKPPTVFPSLNYRFFLYKNQVDRNLTTCYCRISQNMLFSKHVSLAKIDLNKTAIPYT